MAGYSQTPLVKKLGIVDNCVVALLGLPDEVHLELPKDVFVKRQLRGHADVVVAFVTSSAQLNRGFKGMAAAIFPSGGLWVAWPKKSSGVRTDLSDHTVRQIALEQGLVDNKVCAIDATWTGLRVVWRLENRDLNEGSSTGV